MAAAGFGAAATGSGEEVMLSDARGAAASGFGATGAAAGAGRSVAWSADSLGIVNPRIMFGSMAIGLPG